MCFKHDRIVSASIKIDISSPSSENIDAVYERIHCSRSESVLPYMDHYGLYKVVDRLV